MKKFLYLIILILISPIIVFAASNPYPKTQKADYDVSTIPCTYIAWQQAYEKTGVALPNWGNAVNWYRKARAAGYATGNEPRKNSIAVYSGGCCGHVAFVLDVYPDSQLMHVIQGGVYNFDTVNGEETVVAANGNGVAEDNLGYVIGAKYNGMYLTGFIYLDQTPISSNPTNSDSNSKPSSSSQKTTSTVKSDNSYLKSLTIDDLDFAFNKENFTYFLTLPYETSKIKINALPENDKATVTGAEEYNLEVGENSFSVKVIAEDSSSSEYILNITREEKKETTLKPNEAKKTKKNYKLIIIISILLIIIIITTILIIIKQKYKRKQKNHKRKKQKN